MTGAGEILLRCVDLRVARGSREVICGASFAIGDGEVVALLGPNGAGKSTLLDAIGGALAPSSGSIERHGRVAVALQSPDLANRSVRANLVAALAWWGVPRPERAERASRALATMAAGHLADRPARELSGGERRRVHLARALALTPDVLVLDEPFAGLDPAIRAELLTDTGAAVRASARAALVVVHDRAEAWALADRLLILLNGRIAAEGSPRELLAQPPTPEVARFLGFDGELREPGGGVRLTRPQHVRLDPDGSIEARVTALVPVEDGVRLELAVPDGRVSALADLPSPRPGDLVRVQITGGVTFQPAVDAVAADPTVAPAPAQSGMP
jgi:ABC-type multidrug transport system ATPase subunit